jgi:RNA polymerase primary sigma factor
MQMTTPRDPPALADAPLAALGGTVVPANAVRGAAAPYRDGVSVTEGVAEPPDRAPEASESRYLREIGRVPLLTAAQEVALARRVATGARATSALGAGPLGPQERRVQEAQAADGARAQRQLTEANLRLVVSVAKRYTGRGLTLLDLIQEGNLGLMRAAETFDHTRGTRFATYAMWAIRKGMVVALANQGRAIRIPLHVLGTVHAMTRSAGRLQQELGRDATPEEVGKAMGVPAEAVRDLLTIAQATVSLDAPLGDEAPGALADLVPDGATPAPDDVAVQGLLRGDIGRALGRLPEREQHVLRLRFGLLDGRPRTLEEAALALHVSRERVRQIEATALRRLRSPQHRDQLLTYLDQAGRWPG